MSLPEGTHSGRRIEDNLSSIEAIGTPVQRMMATVADVDCNSTYI